MACDLRTLGDEILVFLRNGREQCGRVEGVILARHLVGHDQIDAIGLAAAVAVDPVEFLLEPIGRQVHRAENAHAAGL